MGHVLFTMIFKRFPFGKALDYDDYYIHVINKDPEQFWNLHRNTGVLVDETSDACKNLIFSLL